MPYLHVRIVSFSLTTTSSIIEFLLADKLILFCMQFRLVCSFSFTSLEWSLCTRLPNISWICNFGPYISCAVLCSGSRVSNLEFGKRSHKAKLFWLWGLLLSYIAFYQSCFFEWTLWALLCSHEHQWTICTIVI